MLDIIIGFLLVSAGFWLMVVSVEAIIRQIKNKKNK